MLKEIDNSVFRHQFTTSNNPYISEWFINLVKHKADKVLHLLDESDRSIGLVAGVQDGVIISSFSSPFGGFHYSHEYLMYDVIYQFLTSLKSFVISSNLKGVQITLPPDIYQKNMNAKFVNAFISSGYTMSTPNILNWIDLTEFDGHWVYNKVTNRCRKAIKSNLAFSLAQKESGKKEAYELIRINRVRQGRNIRMSFEDLMMVNDKIPVDFFQVFDTDGSTIGASVAYRGNDNIIQAIFMGDDLNKRDLGAIDFLYMNIYNHYKTLGYKYIDFGTSSLDGEPNIGLLRFKEIHNCKSSLQYTFCWTPELG